jgi:citrate synthase
MTVQPQSPIGLDGVAAAETALSHIDGEKSRLVIAGARVGDLVHQTDFEGLVARLWSSARNETIGEKAVRDQLAEARMSVFRRLPVLLAAACDLPPVEGFRAAIAGLRPEDGLSPEAVLVGAMPVVAAALVRVSEGKEPIAPDTALGHAANTLAMLRGSRPSDEEARALDAYLVTISDHGMNASTFTARVVASTRADLFMSITAAYCALTGPLHGGAPEPVLEMLDAIGSPDRIAPWIEGALSRGERLMGFGHRVYRVRDPRADVLKEMVGLLGSTGVDLGFAAEVEAYAREALAKAKPGRALDTNVEFYTAILLDALAIPRQAFTPIFAIGRVAGWTAHAIEQQRKGRLLRPAALYTGPVPKE